MVIFFNEADLVSFGEFLLSEEREKMYEEEVKVVTKQDLEMWATRKDANDS